MSRPSEVFISHSSEDLEIASRISTYLKHRQVASFFAPQSITQAIWHDEIGAALQRCDWFVVVLSPAAVDSMWVKRELLYALTENRYQNRIVPVLWKDCDTDRLSWTLRQYQRVDVQVDFEIGSEELSRRLGIE